MPRSFTSGEKIQGFERYGALLSGGRAVLVTRASGVEAVAIALVLRRRRERRGRGRETDEDLRRHMATLAHNAGIFVTCAESLDVFVDSAIDAYLRSDLVLLWDGNVGRQFDGCLEHLTTRRRDLPTCAAYAIEPYYFFGQPGYDAVNPYERKTILVVSSHVDSMRSQVDSGNYLRCFAPYGVFRDCVFKFVRPPQTQAGNHGGRDWRANLPRLVEDVRSAGEFDIALVSCGGYGQVVTNYIHRDLGKSAVYVGGPLQLFFGVMGKRWTDNQVITGHRRRNRRFWIEPLESDRPPNAEGVGEIFEAGCYW